MSLFDVVKKETKTHHQSVEKVLVKELKDLKSLNDYGNLLKRLYQFYVPIENDLQNIISTEIVEDIQQRKHNHRLLKDIKDIDSSYNENPENKHLEINDLSYALGVMYVIEGSTMGGQIISKMLQKNLDLQNENMTSYFNSYGNESMQMWTLFKNQVTSSSSKISEKQMVEGAKATFTALENWLKASA